MTRWTKRSRYVPISIGLLLASLSMACGSADTGAGHDAGTAHDEHGESPAAGPNGGRLLSSGAFELELAIVERGTPPEFRAWATLAGQAVDPSDFTLTVKLTRLGGRVEAVAFTPRGDHRASTNAIAEPCSPSAWRGSPLGCGVVCWRRSPRRDPRRAAATSWCRA